MLSGLSLMIRNIPYVCFAFRINLKSVNMKSECKIPSKRRSVNTNKRCSLMRVPSGGNFSTMFAAGITFDSIDDLVKIVTSLRTICIYYAIGLRSFNTLYVFCVLRSPSKLVDIKGGLYLKKDDPIYVPTNVMGEVRACIYCNVCAFQLPKWAGVDKSIRSFGLTELCQHARNLLLHESSREELEESESDFASD